MANTVKKDNETMGMNTINNPLLIDEIEIVELEDRLELVNRCNVNCSPSAIGA